MDQTVLASEQVDEEGNSWRSGAKVQQKYLSQWFFKISEYAEVTHCDINNCDAILYKHLGQNLLDGLDEVDWADEVKSTQRNWIGKSEGVYFDFKVQVRKEAWLLC